jgi:hypothetical protein
MTAPAVHGLQAYRRGCRCDVCVATNYGQQKRWRARVKDGPVPVRVHGTLNGYQIYGCRCGACRETHRLAYRRRAAQKRRLWRLAAAGLPGDWEEA